MGYDRKQFSKLLKKDIVLEYEQLRSNLHLAQANLMKVCTQRDEAKCELEQWRDAMVSTILDYNTDAGQDWYDEAEHAQELCKFAYDARDELRVLLDEFTEAALAEKNTARVATAAYNKITAKNAQVLEENVRLTEEVGRLQHYRLALVACMAVIEAAGEDLPRPVSQMLRVLRECKLAGKEDEG